MECGKDPSASCPHGCSGCSFTADRLTGSSPKSTTLHGREDGGYNVKTARSKGTCRGVCEPWCHRRQNAGTVGTQRLKPKSLQEGGAGAGIKHQHGSIGSSGMVRTAGSHEDPTCKVRLSHYRTACHWPRN